MGVSALFLRQVLSLNPELDDSVCMAGQSVRFRDLPASASLAVRTQAHTPWLVLYVGAGELSSVPYVSIANASLSPISSHMHGGMVCFSVFMEVKCFLSCNVTHTQKSPLYLEDGYVVAGEQLSSKNTCSFARTPTG